MLSRALLLFTGFLAAHTVSASLLLEESFSYPAGALNGQGSWTGGSGPQVIAGNLAYPSLPTPLTASNKVSLPVTASTALKAFNGTAITSGNIYLSFILRQTTLTGSTTGGTLAGLDDDGTVTTSNGRVAAALGIHIKQTNSTSYLVGIRKGQGASGAGGGTDLFYTGSSFTTNDVVFVVARYSFGQSTGDDTVTLWINPATNSFGGAEPDSSIPATTTANSTDAAELQYVFVRCNSSTTSGANELDDLRVGTTWADITPNAGPVAPPPVPIITHAQILPQGVVLRGTNGPGNGVYQILGTTNLHLPLTNWPWIAAHTFDAFGNFDSTNPVAPGLPQQFFRLQVGGTLPPVPAAPSITNEPQSLILAVGQDANFTVSASGTAPLNYFWSFNTNTPVGGNTSTLSLAGVTTDDAGAYRVIVSNSVGTATSAVATLTVLVPPTITSDPTNLTVLAGSNATFNVSASGSGPLRYQWFFNTNTALLHATNASFALSSVHVTNAGAYSIIVTNVVGAATSAVAMLTVLSPPSLAQQPQSQSVNVSNNVQFTAEATGTAPLAWQWFFNTNTPLANATNSALNLTNVQPTNAGAYFVRVTNSYGAVTSSVATLTVTTNQSFALYNLYGFGAPTTGGGELAEANANYRKVYNAGDLRLALANSATKVIEIMNDLNLGWNEIGTTNRTGAFRQSTAPSLHPVLIASGITTVDIQDKNGLTIFSANGATLRHVEFNLKRAHNVIIRNLKFDELWEWDELTKGDYDSKDWDFITIGDGGNCTNVWVDHCTFTKAYDGVVDLKGGNNRVTVSWCNFIADDGGPDSFVRKQIVNLETNGTSQAMFDFLRGNGFSVEDIIAIARSQKKGHLAGATEFDADNANLKLTLHHNHYRDMQDRHPRLRAGNAHVYNIYINNTNARAAKLLRNARVAAIPGGLGNYKFDVTLNGAISTEDGAVLVEKCHIMDVTSPLRNNQTDPSNAAYTGKIRATDTIYSLDGSYFRGDSEDSGSPLAPVPATIKPFSWNGFVNLPYAYVLDDPANLAAQIGGGGAAVGAGTLNWAKTNWLKTSYP